MTTGPKSNPAACEHVCLLFMPGAGGCQPKPGSLHRLHKQVHRTWPAAPEGGHRGGPGPDPAPSPQATTRTSVSSVAAASGMRARSRATSESTRVRSPTSAMAVARSSASSTSWRRTTECTQVPGPVGVWGADGPPGRPGGGWPRVSWRAQGEGEGQG